MNLKVILEVEVVVLLEQEEIQQQVVVQEIKLEVVELV
jgi:hypothetical protein